MELDDAMLLMCAGEDSEAEEAFACLYDACWPEILRGLKSKRMVCGLTLEQKKSAVTDAFVELWRKARAGEIRDTDKDPRALLHHIAFRRGVDLVRRNTAKRRHMTPEEWEAFRNQVIEEATFGTQLKLLERNGLANEVIDDFLAWMEQQKGVCRRTALAMTEFLPDLATPSGHSRRIRRTAWRIRYGPRRTFCTSARAEESCQGP